MILAKKPLYHFVANYKGVSKATGNTFTGTRRSFNTDNGTGSYPAVRRSSFTGCPVR